MRFLNSSFYQLVWILLFLIPVVTTVASIDRWDISPWYLVAVSTWYLFIAASLLGRKAFLLLSFPIIFIGLVMVVGDFHRNVSVLELISVFDTFSRTEIIDSIMPYRYWLLLTLGMLGFLALGVWVSSADYKVGVRNPVILIIIGIAMVTYLPSSSWIRAWPATLFSLAFAHQVGNQSLLVSILPFASVNPREGSSPWEVERDQNMASAELYVLVIGESVRADRLAECGGRQGMHAVTSEAIVYCDVLSGSSSTHTSVPLLISRDNLGINRRITQDASFISAFNQLGFSSYWLSTQEVSIAWPDAEHIHRGKGVRDEDTLMPLFEQALADESPRKLLVLHAYNAHFNYVDRYPQDEAAFPVSIDLKNKRPDRANLEHWWNAYDSAVNESMEFLDLLIERIKEKPGHVFLLYTSDHGENMMDDDRDLTDHALTFPTRWDTGVPAIIWANEAWRADNPRKYVSLMQNKSKPLMHLDLIPTMLGAAGITYQEERTLPVDLTVKTVGKRTRIVQKLLGETVTEDGL
jgi:glucan phosphoethanolaminetransferase (alkaline phosphatase superfamily)